MEEALVNRLVASAGVAQFAHDRVSWFGRQRGDGLPALTLALVSPGREWTHGGPDNLDRAWVQFDCWADSAAGAVSLGRAVRAEMEQAATVLGVTFHPAMLVGQATDDETNPDGGARLFRVRMDFQFYHEETA